ncbi:hypothetical protein BZG35_04890 [Brevundimonas sp. LM2]|uniref:S41 family peptidase n=1 Tax=Brevundimonas sp. LM2 TaxID=1938605 RepID=UPI0009840331|nr:S41 family peptidase [Brevundimonas sp. LM2]AQR61073.1 hypothetical protein BZG35_04890 [Brevundimonas sp. LM2]
MLSRRRLLHLSGGLALATATPAFAQDAVTEDWSGDVEILRQAWQALHSGLYRYSTPEQMTGRLDGLSTAWKAPAAFRARFLALTRVTAAVRCGHTYPSPYNGEAALRDRLYPGRELVPFRYVWIDGRMVVTRDDSAEGLFPRGTAVTAINGIPTRDLLARLIPLARADGHNDAKRISLMAVRGDDTYETADIHLPLVLPGLVDRAAFTLADGRVVRGTLLTLAERQAGAPSAVQPTGAANPWTLARGADGIARLTMPGWALYNSTFDWETWLGGVMDDLTGDGARGLIVDLRGNEGGEDCGNVILTRLVASDLALPMNRRFTRYRRAPEALWPYLDTWDRSFLDWGEAALGPDDRGLYRLTRYDDGDAPTLIRPAGRRFAGPVVVLCDASNSSATFAFAQTVKDSGLATLIGTPTGGNRRGINGGAFFFLRLPASRIEVDLPLIATMPDGPQPDAGIVPDRYVPTTAADIVAGTDPQMAAATADILAA